MNKNTTRSKLRIHRETVRTLTAGEMAVVAGGAVPDPRSNGWTARSDLLCGGAVVR